VVPLPCSFVVCFPSPPPCVINLLPLRSYSLVEFVFSYFLLRLPCGDILFHLLFVWGLSAPLSILFPHLRIFRLRSLIVVIGMTRFSHVPTQPWARRFLTPPAFFLPACYRFTKHWCATIFSPGRPHGCTGFFLFFFHCAPHCCNIGVDTTVASAFQHPARCLFSRPQYDFF